MRGGSTSQGGRLALGVAAVALLAGCAGAGGAVAFAPAAGPGSGSPVPVSVVGPARWLPVVASGAQRLAVEEPDGSLEVVEGGLRWVEHPDGRLERARELLPDGVAQSWLRLPSRLGGGFVFRAASRSGSSTSLYHAPTFVGPLRPLARLQFSVGQLVAGLDRLYVTSQDTHGVVGVDLTTGQPSRVDTLPRAAGYGSVVFSDGWVGAIEADLRGVLVTFDAGVTWRPVPIATTTPAVFEQGGRLLLGTPRGLFALEASGELERVDAPDAEALRDGMRTATFISDESPLDDLPLAERAGSSRPRPLEAAVLRGVPDSAGTALVVLDGALLRVALSDGTVIASAPRVVPADARCVGVRLFSGVGFVCGREAGATTVHALRAPLALAPVLEFDGPRSVLPGGTGALAVAGGCGRAAGDAATYCIVSAAGARREVRLLGDTGAGRVVALADGRAIVIAPPRLGAPGSVSVVGSDGVARAVPLDVSSLVESARDLVTQGLWLHGFVDAGDSVAGWVAGSGSLVGVRVAVTGKVTAGVVRTAAVDGVGLAGPFALVSQVPGVSWETVDGGVHWAEVTLPGPTSAGEAADRERGCSAVGCSVGTWMRVGWGDRGDGAARSEADDLKRVEAPPPAERPAARYVSWSLECALTGEVEGPRDVEAQVGRGRSWRPRAEPRATRATALPEALESSGWRTFLGAPPPELAPGELGFDLGTEAERHQVRGYAWGLPEVPWDRQGSWLVRAVDRFSVKGAVWSTATSRTPWSDARAAAEVFGSDPTHQISSKWVAILDPVEPAGVLLARSGATSMYVIEKERAVVAVRDTDELHDQAPAGAVRVAGRWYLGVPSGGRSFQVFSIQSGALVRVGAYPRHADGSTATIVRTVRGDAVGVWVVARGQRGALSGGDDWLVHPLDPHTGQLGEPLVVPFDALSAPPRPCAPGEDGWVLLHEVSPSVGRVEILDRDGWPPIGGVEARLVAGVNGICMDSLAARVTEPPVQRVRERTPGDADATRPGAPRPYPLALTDRAMDRRFGLRCSH